MGTLLEDLQRKARLLENEIDVRLISLNKFNGSNSSLPSDAHYNQQTKAQGKRSLFDSLAGEIESRLTKLGEINDAMQECSESGKADFNRAPQQHILRRHRDILRDYHAEFNRTFANINSHLQREELMEMQSGPPSSSGGAAQSSAHNRCRPTDYLIRENESISDCDRLLNDQISIAMSVREGLYTQTSGLGNIGKRMHHLTKKYPALNNLMNKIRMKKRKDTLILAAVISSCLIFIFIYMMH